MALSEGGEGAEWKLANFSPFSTLANSTIFADG